MAVLPFTKAQGAGNDFLIVSRDDLGQLGIVGSTVAQLAERMCDRRFGLGADGLEVVKASDTPEVLAHAHLFNSDGSEAEISGNGTRCVAAYLSLRQGLPARFVIGTGAGPRELVRTRQEHPEYEFRMRTPIDQCRVIEDELHLEASGDRHQVTLVDVGNPQCVRRVDSFDFDWPALGAGLGTHPGFLHGSNVSFVKVIDNVDAEPALEVRFWERGVGSTLSSGTGSLGAAVAAHHHGWVGSCVEVKTEGGNLLVDWADGIHLTGSARIVAQGTYEVR